MLSALWHGSSTSSHRLAKLARGLLARLCSYRAHCHASGYQRSLLMPGLHSKRWCWKLHKGLAKRLSLSLQHAQIHATWLGSLQSLFQTPRRCSHWIFLLVLIVFVCLFFVVFKKIIKLFTTLDSHYFTTAFFFYHQSSNTTEYVEVAIEYLVLSNFFGSSTLHYQGQ